MADDDEQKQSPKLELLSRVQRRLVRSALEIEAEQPDSLLYQHALFCQAGLPYRNPGDETRLWERLNGFAHLEVLAGKAMHPEKRRLVPLGLPFGPKPRLVLAYLNAEALRTGSPQIEVQESLTAFVKRLKLAAKGQNIRIIKDQLARLAASSIRLGFVRDGRAFTVNSQIVSAFDLWFPKDERQRVLWPSTVRLSLDYFESLQNHAVPLDERAVAAMAHNAMALDVYAWLAQRLHRVKKEKPAFIPWTALHAQFGWHYGRLRDFRRSFRQILELVLTQYRGARIAPDEQGLTLRNSPPPIKGRIGPIL